MLSFRPVFSSAVVIFALVLPFGVHLIEIDEKNIVAGIAADRAALNLFGIGQLDAPTPSGGTGGTQGSPLAGGGESSKRDSVGESWCEMQRLPCIPWSPPVVEGTTAAGPITISDIATFRPQQPTAGMQPNQWTIVGLATNFFANASAHVVDGSLFGGTAQVRFTPISYGWNYGDGTTANLKMPGTTWAKQQIVEFDPTPTSHIFEQSGNYTIALTVTYKAEYRVAGAGWRNVIGTLAVPAPPLTATAGHASTVLVDKNCIANPSGIGC